MRNDSFNPNPCYGANRAYVGKVVGSGWHQHLSELPPDDLDTMLEDRRAPFRVDRLGSMVDGDVE